jgi:hypothetical protein
MQLSLNGTRERETEFIKPILRKGEILDTSGSFGQAFPASTMAKDIASRLAFSVPTQFINA